MVERRSGTLVLAPGLVIDKMYYYWGRPSSYQLRQCPADLFRRIKPDCDPATAAARQTRQSVTLPAFWMQNALNRAGFTAFCIQNA